ncbi:hypothetical protein PV325_000135 [Microctonus aethiopoides]|uniref:aralkylamine N-acetyltransferase n=1 Tax=Microctonus aethiopoides TaxID=144406 RepID=A0AA39FLR4_9HYME|nr:hypothetical protein PV325_000135 [Microctonus aethiopoides]KAK0171634.1 hypothetical protein PV328_005064 [Microctonus aethiopoides]
MDQLIDMKMGKIGITGVNFPAEDMRKMTRYSLADKMDENETTTMEYHIIPIGIKDQQKIIAFLRRFFFRDEPLNHSIQLIPEGENSTCIPLEEYSTSSIDENLSFMAVSSTGTIVGVLLNGKTQAAEHGEPEYITNCESPKFKKTLKLLHYVDQKANLINRYPNKNGIDIRIISVDNNWRGRGIAAALFEKTIAIARELKYDYIRADCTSHFTAKLCKRLGFDSIYELRYADYVDENGKPVFLPSLPHTAITTYVRKL